MKNVIRSNMDGKINIAENQSYLTNIESSTTKHHEKKIIFYICKWFYQKS